MKLKIIFVALFLQIIAALSLAQDNLIINTLNLQHLEGGRFVPIGPDGGPIAEMISDPLNTDIVYAVSGNSIRSPDKLYKSTDGGENWTLQYTFAYYIYCMDVAPNNSNILNIGNSLYLKVGYG